MLARAAGSKEMSYKYLKNLTYSNISSELQVCCMLNSVFNSERRLCFLLTRFYGITKHKNNYFSHN
jgi:hypothetical protein